MVKHSCFAKTAKVFPLECFVVYGSRSTNDKPLPLLYTLQTIVMVLSLYDDLLIIRAEPNMLKVLPIIPSQTS